MNDEILKNLEVFLVERNNQDTKKNKIIHKLDGRIIPLEPRILRETSKELANMINFENVNYILGFAEGGILAAYGVSDVTNIPMIGSYRLRLKATPEIIFNEPHSERSTHYIYGLKSGDKIVIIEDEITTGSTLTSAVKELTRQNIEVADIGSFIICKNFRDTKHPELEKYNIKHLLEYEKHIY